MSFGYSRTLEGSAGNPNEAVFLDVTVAPESGQVLKGNGTTNFGAVRAGAAMGKITASSKWRPCGKQIVNGAYGPGVVLPMQSVDGFYVGDVVTIYDVSGSTTVATTRTITAINASASPPTMTISGANVTVEAGDYVYVEDGSGTARGLLLAGIFTQDTVDEDGDPVHQDQGGQIVFQGVIDEDKADAVIKLNTHIKTDLQTVSNGCLILMK